MEPNDSEQSTAAALIREAFDRARQSGKADWHRMTTAVLNNRLLQITDGDFSISRYGAGTVVEFVKMFPELVRVAESADGGPAIVSLVESPEERAQTHALSGESPRTSTRPQVREDLWRATMDWNDGHTYVVDPVTGRARLRQETDPPELEAIAGVSKELYVQWRYQFIEEALAQTADDRERTALTRWRDVPGPSRNLPTKLQDAWMDTLRTRVTDHIREWFASVGKPAPEDLTRIRATTERSSVSAPTEVAVATQKLRDLVRRCVDQMSYEELRSLQLPAGVVARAFVR